MKKILLSLLIVALLCQSPCLASLDAEGEGQEVRLPVIMYHHMSPKPKLWGDYTVSVEEFEADLEYLKSNGYETISIQELLDWSEGNGVLPEKPIMITFDDGHESTLAYGVPLLEKYGFNAVVAVIGSYADTYTEADDHQLDYSYMTWEQIRDISGDGCLEIQYHSYDLHNQDNRRGCGMKRGESLDSYRRVLCEDYSVFSSRCEEYDVNLCPSVAFPFGFYCDETIEITRDWGAKIFFTCEERVNTISPYQEWGYKLGRFNRPHGISQYQLFSKFNN